MPIQRALVYSDSGSESDSDSAPESESDSAPAPATAPVQPFLSMRAVPVYGIRADEVADSIRPENVLVVVPVVQEVHPLEPSTPVYRAYTLAGREVSLPRECVVRCERLAEIMRNQTLGVTIDECHAMLEERVFAVACRQGLPLCESEHDLCLAVLKRAVMRRIVLHRAPADSSTAPTAPTKRLCDRPPVCRRVLTKKTCVGAGVGIRSIR